MDKISIPLSSIYHGSAAHVEPTPEEAEAIRLQAEADAREAEKQGDLDAFGEFLRALGQSGGRISGESVRGQSMDKDMRELSLLESLRAFRVETDKRLEAILQGEGRGDVPPQPATWERELLAWLEERGRALIAAHSDDASARAFAARQCGLIGMDAVNRLRLALRERMDAYRDSVMEREKRDFLALLRQPPSTSGVFRKRADTFAASYAAWLQRKGHSADEARRAVDDMLGEARAENLGVALEGYRNADPAALAALFEEAGRIRRTGEPIVWHDSEGHVEHSGDGQEESPAQALIKELASAAPDVFAREEAAARRSFEHRRLDDAFHSLKDLAPHEALARLQEPEGAYRDDNGELADMLALHHARRRRVEERTRAGAEDAALRDILELLNAEEPDPLAALRRLKEARLAPETEATVLDVLRRADFADADDEETLAALLKSMLRPGISASALVDATKRGVSRALVTGKLSQSGAQSLNALARHISSAQGRPDRIALRAALAEGPEFCWDKALEVLEGVEDARR